MRRVSKRRENQKKKSSTDFFLRILNSGNSFSLSDPLNSGGSFELSDPLNSGNSFSLPDPLNSGGSFELPDPLNSGSSFELPDPLNSGGSFELSDTLNISDVEFHSRLASIVSEGNPSRAFTSKLLVLLRQKGIRSLPMDKRTLLQTPRGNNIVNLDEGQFFYLGLKEQILFYFNKFKIDIFSTSTNLLVQLNFDGVVVSENTTTCLWPILISISNLSLSPIIIGCYYGKHKLYDIENYLKEFIDDFNFLVNNGFCYNNKYVFKKLFFSLTVKSPIFQIFFKCLKYIMFTSEKKFHVVVDDDEAMPIPERWIIDDSTSYFPPGSKNAIKSFVKRQKLVASDWIIQRTVKKTAIPLGDIHFIYLILQIYLTFSLFM